MLKPCCQCASSKEGSHSGELQAKTFLEVIDEYGLSGKVGCFTMDNDDANDTIFCGITEIEGLDPVAKRLHCSSHVMNIVVQFLISRSKAKKIQEDEQEGIDEAYERLCRLSQKGGGGRITTAYRGVAGVSCSRQTPQFVHTLPASTMTSRPRLVGPCRGTMMHVGTHGFTH